VYKRQGGVAGAAVSRLEHSARPSLPSRVGDLGRVWVYYSGMIFLASRSPRRTELLAQIGVEFSVCAIDIDESRMQGEAAEEYVCRLARQKGEAAASRLARERADYAVLAADTTIALDGDIIGKPADREQCRCILGQLSARQHLVLTAVALVTPDATAWRLCRSRVKFRALSAQEIEGYCASDEPMDKAGAYGIQGRAAMFIEHLEGSYSGVMGLPLFETAALLRGA